METEPNEEQKRQLRRIVDEQRALNELAFGKEIAAAISVSHSGFGVAMVLCSSGKQGKRVMEAMKKQMDEQFKLVDKIVQEMEKGTRNE